VLLGEDAVEQGGFARAEEPGEDGDGDAVVGVGSGLVMGFFVRVGGEPAGDERVVDPGQGGGGSSSAARTRSVSSALWTR
jgi:hypothetical protein